MVIAGRTINPLCSALLCIELSASEEPPMSYTHDRLSATPVTADDASRMPTDEAAPGDKPSLSMHANVPVWYDCCSCEAEPYWQQAMAETEQQQQEHPDTE